MPTEIRYLTGDVTRGGAAGPRIIAHLGNDLGPWGKGVARVLAGRWPELPDLYQRWRAGAPDDEAQTSGAFALGAAQLAAVTDYDAPHLAWPSLWVATVVGQRGYRAAPDGTPPVRYEAIAAGLAHVAEWARDYGAEVYMPRLGCGLAGGTWDRVAPLVAAALCARRVAVTVYDPPARRRRAPRKDPSPC